MKQLLKASLIIITFGALLSFIPNEEKELTGKLTLNEWNVLILSVNSPDDVSANQKKAVLGKLIPQLQKQATDTTKKK